MTDYSSYVLASYVAAIGLLSALALVVILKYVAARKKILAQNNVKNLHQDEK